MARPTRLTIAKKDIFAGLESTGRKVFSPAQLAGILSENREFWRLSRGTTVAQFIEFLAKQGKLRKSVLKSEAYGREIARYSWGEASIYEVAQSLMPKGYLSHGTAVALHGLNDLLPSRVYVNVEQSAKPPPKGGLTQRGIDQAFSRDQRQSNMTYEFEGRSITIINGKHTDSLGVEEILGPSEERLRVTDLERTLVDIAVRPAYAGGLFQVLEAYRTARGRVSTNRLLATLKKLNYVYPYHQSVGFLMERAGYDRKLVELFKQPGLDYDFYMTHGITNPKYSSEWRIYYPEGI